MVAQAHHAMTHAGRCLCGSARYEASGRVPWVQLADGLPEHMTNPS